jgi:purine-binding chemotaxis protein CheW
MQGNSWSNFSLRGNDYMEIWQQFSEEELNILKARAKQIASRGGDEIQRHIIPALTVLVNQTAYAFPIDYLLAVYVQMPIIHVPSVPSYIQGIVNIRGHITPVLNLAVLFDTGGETTLPEKYYLIVASKDKNTVAFFVERIGDLLSVDVDTLSPIAEHTAARQYLWGITPQATTILKLASILDDDSLIVNRTVG